MPTRRPLTRLRDIVQNGQAALRYTRGLDFAAYEQNQYAKDATERCISRALEAAVKLGDISATLFPNHNWRGMRDIGNVLRHAYADVVDSAIWAVVTRALPPLLADLESFLAQYPEDQETL